MISVLIPTFNAENYIGEAIESVLAQSFQDFEIIVVDDGSSDQTEQVVKSFKKKILYYHQKKSGVGAARNHCVRVSNGEFLAFLDADDVWTQRKLELQMQEFAADYSLDAVFGMVKQVLQKDWDQKLQDLKISETEYYKGFIQGTMLIKREAFLRIGMFPEDRTIGEFVDWLLRAKEGNLQMKLLPELFLLRRIHKTNLTIRHRSKYGDYLKILKNSIDRRRINESDKNNK